MVEYTREQLLAGLSEDEINAALKVISRINFTAAYGHSPEICEASGIMKQLLDKDSHLWSAFEVDSSNEIVSNEFVTE